MNANLSTYSLISTATYLQPTSFYIHLFMFKWLLYYCIPTKHFGVLLPLFFSRVNLKLESKKTLNGLCYLVQIQNA